MTSGDDTFEEVLTRQDAYRQAALARAWEEGYAACHYNLHERDGGPVKGNPYLSDPPAETVPPEVRHLACEHGRFKHECAECTKPPAETEGRGTPETAPNPDGAYGQLMGLPRSNPRER